MGGFHIAWFPDPNIGYLFGYDSGITDEGVLVTFLGGRIRILFRPGDIRQIHKETYRGGRISWDVIRWGKCPHGKEALKVTLKQGIFKDHLVVFDRLDDAVGELQHMGVNVKR